MAFPNSLSLLKLNCTYSLPGGPRLLHLHATPSTFLDWTYIPPSLHTEGPSSLPPRDLQLNQVSLSSTSFCVSSLRSGKSTMGGLISGAAVFPSLLPRSFSTHHLHKWVHLQRLRQWENGETTWPSASSQAGRGAHTQSLAEQSELLNGGDGALSERHGLFAVCHPGNDGSYNPAAGD